MSTISPTNEWVSHPRKTADLEEFLERVQSESMNKRVVPCSTYRLQLHQGFTLKDAMAIVPYLHRLGVSHLYVSSLLTARRGSMHGYDIISHQELNPELGSEQDLAALSSLLHDRGMGMIVDIVPNHMCVCEENDWWMDVLEHGPASRYANYFDIAWHDHPRERMRGKILLPILDEPYGEAVQAGRMKPIFSHGRFLMQIDAMKFPIDVRTYDMILEPALESVRVELTKDSEELQELQSIISAVRHLPARDDPDESRVSELLTEGSVIQRRLKQLIESHPLILVHINQSLERLGGTKGDPESFNALDQLLDGQAYRACFWRVALDEINYRRFFDVNDLAALATEREEVFEAIHRKPFEWLQNGWIDGFRIDHVDGLLDPKQYLDRLQQHYLLACLQASWSRSEESQGGIAWEDVEPALKTLIQSTESKSHLYVVVEKILGPHEHLPDNWVCDGTTGYEFMNQVNGLFVDAVNRDSMTDVYESFTDQRESFAEIAFEKKLQILRSTMASELQMLALRLDRLAQSQWWSKDFTLNGLRTALEVFVASMDVYRSYVAQESNASDRAVIRRAARRANKNSPLLGRKIFDFIAESVLLVDHSGTVSTEEYVDQRRQFVGKFQQLCTVVMAKGVEDTTFYLFNRLLSLNEVGGEPSLFGRSPEDVHRYFQRRATRDRLGLSPLSTHDTKRGEDTRARLNVLSEFVPQWRESLDHWHKQNEEWKTEWEDGLVAPDCNEEYFIYQTLVGMWPTEAAHVSSDLPITVAEDFVGRVRDYMIKAMRESKIHTSWIHPNAEYEAAVIQFVENILDAQKSQDFLKHFGQFQSMVGRVALFNSFSQSLIRCTAPGVPDTFQGTEGLSYCVVDPDNRRPVDYAKLERNLTEIDKILNAKVKHDQAWVGNEEMAKQFIVTAALNLRRRYPKIFAEGSYMALETSGPDAKHLFAFGWHYGTQTVLVVVPRLVGALDQRGYVDKENRWLTLDAQIASQETDLRGSWQCMLTGKTMIASASRMSASDLFTEWSVALLLRVEE